MATCGICLEILNANQSEITTKCNHSFHNKCLTPWLINKNTCPLCRHEIYEKFIDEDSDLESDDEDEPEYHVHIDNSIITLEDSSVTKITQRIIELTDHMESDFQDPLKHNWYIDDDFVFYTTVNTKKYKSFITFNIYKYQNDYYINVTSNTIYIGCEKDARIITHGYEKWRTQSHINNQTSISCS